MSTKSLYALSLDQCIAAILAGGSQRTILFEGHMGTGKSAMHSMLRQQPELSGYHFAYFDCTTKDLGDITVPNIKMLDEESGEYVSFATNEEFGVQFNKPICLMIDELGKANPAVKNALLRVMHPEDGVRHIGTTTFHPDSIVFATTNLGVEGVGDMLLPHQYDRLTIVRTRKPSSDEWIEWGINNGVDHTLLGFVKDNPQVMQSFEDVKDPENNLYIFHPQAKRRAFVTPRSLEAASDWMKQRDRFDDQTLTALLLGTIGEKATNDLMAFVKLADQMPTLQSIKDSPNTAVVPKSAPAIVMVVYRTLATLDKTWVDAWMDYLVRLDKEAQGYFVNGVRSAKYDKKKQSVVMTNKKFTKWAMDNNYMFAADKK
ncbi:MAG TPA: sigma 54-interacting transcriptional regulator [Candidatus Paceibacterota bacterium]|nr:sigma 54-interacting transcriptional regulator [Candidatus Paceibacterota bacterium]